jgi:hypothetical protein
MISAQDRTVVLSTLVPFTLPTAFAPLVFLLWPALSKKTVSPVSRPSINQSDSRVDDKYSFMLPLADHVASDDRRWESFITAIEQNETPRRT